MDDIRVHTTPASTAIQFAAPKGVTFYDRGRGAAAVLLSALVPFGLGYLIGLTPSFTAPGARGNVGLVDTAAEVLTCFAAVICSYYVLLAWLTRRDGRDIARVRARVAPTRVMTPHDRALVVIVVPARNEAVVIERTVERAQRMAGDPVLIVMDDGSDDGTGDVARACADPERTIVVSRDPAIAGRGKGDVLNAAVRLVSQLVSAGDPRMRGHSATDVIVCILDADGWLDGHAIEHVTPMFADLRIGGVQLSVRMLNARAGFLARMQDIEFVAYGSLFQSARNQLGSVLMGGNGQFMRLTALQSLGARPWTDCLTEDLEIGLRLARRGWRLVACPSACVSQQALTSPVRFVRQRTRWVQGHLSCWTQLPGLWSRRTHLRFRARIDLSLHLLLGCYGLLAALQVVVFAALLAGLLAWDGMAIGPSPLLAATAFGVLMLVPIVLVGCCYQCHANARLSAFTVLGVMAAYTLYHYLWSVPATTLALVRIVSRRRGWAKTSRAVITHNDLAAHALAVEGMT